MDTHEVELENAVPAAFAVTVPAVPGLLIFGATVDEVLARART
jgi:predicted RNase H-like HicB family nuclease